MSKSKCPKNLYCAFLEVTSTRFSALSLSEIPLGNMTLSHDSISRWLAISKVRQQDLWGVAKKIADKKDIPAFDDVVINKSRSEKMELVNWQYSGMKYGVVKGIGIVNALWQISKENYTPIDYRIWNPIDDTKTKKRSF